MSEEPVGAVASPDDDEDEDDEDIHQYEMRRTWESR